VGVDSRARRTAAILRRFQVSDVESLMAVGKESPEAAKWSKESYLKHSEDSGAVFFVTEEGGGITGFLVGRIVGDQGEIFNLAVKQGNRRLGRGKALISKATEEFESRGVKNVYLEVRESNTGAIAFYERQGFANTGRRKGYYREPDEAAVTMEKKLTG
jgi:[ribosomal protein S18]-alanine N-acetyltransferase